MVSGSIKTYQKTLFNALCYRLIGIDGYTRTYLDEFRCAIILQSFCTNVPLRETVDFLYDFIFAHNIKFDIPIDDLKDLILMYTENIRFDLEGEAYKQIDVVAMGSSLGRTLADIFLGMVERHLWRDI